MEKKGQNKGFLLRLDPETMELVERWAAQEFRSVNGQIQWIINDALTRYKRKPKAKASRKESE
ncbi:MAG: toxin-antitoxin system HicB family antitoxin [Staphylococcus sp.]|nr:toxin-antitoxin system HicB family antitoxin [Staphylococcus sp.]